MGLRLSPPEPSRGTATAVSILSVFGAFTLVAAPLGLISAMGRPGTDPIRITAVFLVLSAAGVGLLYVSKRLREGRPWARWAAVASFLVLAGAVSAFTAATLSGREDDVGIGVLVAGTAAVAAASLLGLVLLLLPGAAADFRRPSTPR